MDNLDLVIKKAGENLCEKLDDTNKVLEGLLDFFKNGVVDVEDEE